MGHRSHQSQVLMGCCLCGLPVPTYYCGVEDAMKMPCGCGQVLTLLAGVWLCHGPQWDILTAASRLKGEIQNVAQQPGTNKIRLQKWCLPSSLSLKRIRTDSCLSTDALRLVILSPSHMFQTFQTTAFVLGHRASESTYKRFKSGFSIFYSSTVFLNIILIGFQRQIFGELVCSAGPTTSGFLI